MAVPCWVPELEEQLTGFRFSFSSNIYMKCYTFPSKRCFHRIPQVLRSYIFMKETLNTVERPRSPGKSQRPDGASVTPRHPSSLPRVHFGTSPAATPPPAPTRGPHPRPGRRAHFLSDDVLLQPQGPTPSPAPTASPAPPGSRTPVFTGAQLCRGLWGLRRAPRAHGGLVFTTFTAFTFSSPRVSSPTCVCEETCRRVGKRPAIFQFFFCSLCLVSCH